MTITEFMIALLISAIIGAALLQIFVRSRATYTYQQDLSRSQETARIAASMLTRDIRMSGYFGCRNHAPGDDLYINPPLQAVYQSMIPTTERTGITGFRYTGTGGTNPVADWTPPLPAVFFPAADSAVLRPYSDVLLIRYATSTGISLLANVNGDAPSPILIPSDFSNAFRPLDVVLMSSCEHADVFQITAVTVAGPALSLTVGSPTLGPPGKTHSYDVNTTEFLSFVSRAYYVQNSTTTGQPGLWRKELAAGTPVAQEVVQGVEATQFAFGLTPGGGVDATPQNYLTANLVPATQWPFVRSVRVGMVLRTDNQVTSTPDDQRYDVLGAQGSGPGDAFDDYPPASVSDPATFFNDRRQRDVYTLVVEKRKPLK
jgi:type IV pilus assembly protein PilW